MGKVIDALAHGPMPEQTIFDKRMVVECCETFHVHWRNLRLELSPENWVDFLATMERAARTWQESGSPRSHVHLELARHWIQHPPVNTGELDVELCDNLYKVAPPPFGDGALLDDDDFVHFHIHDLRVEMSVSEFVQFAGVLGAARGRLAARGAGLETLLGLLDEHNVLYVVLRNWEALPHSVELGEHSDLDLLVHPLHVPVLDEIWRTTRTFDDPTRVQRRVPVVDDEGNETFLLCDVRVPGDGYMPTAWSHELIARRRRHEMFWVLGPEDYFLSLLYHAVHHKGVMRADYAERLVELARAAGIDYPVEATRDLGAAARLLRRHGIERSEPDDRSVLPHLPFLHPVETAVSSRLLEPTGILSRVHVLDGAEGRVVVKHASGGLAEREAQLLARLSPPFAPRLLDLAAAPGGATVTMEAIEGYALTDVAAVASLDEAAAIRLAEGALDLLDALAAAGVRHRDIRPDNVIVRDGLPVLVDFGWAEAIGLEQEPPDGLGGDGYATPEGAHDDAYALGRTLSLLALLHPRLAPLVVALTEPDPDLRVSDTAALRPLLGAEPNPDSTARVAEAFAAYPAAGLLIGYVREGLRRAAERHPHDEALRVARERVELAATTETAAAPPSAPVGDDEPGRTLAGEPVRSFVVAAFADEVAAEPELLRTYAGFFNDHDDVTLLLWAPDRDPAEVIDEILPAVEATGLAGGPGADLLALALPREMEPEIAAGLGAVYSLRHVNGSLTGIPVFRPETIADLRSLAVSPPAKAPVALVGRGTAPAEADIARMKADWNERATENAHHYIASARDDWDEAEFSESGRKSVQATVGNDLDRVTAGRDPGALVALEIGCGVGRMTEHLGDLFREVHGVDVSGEMVRQARGRLGHRPDLHFHETSGADVACLADESVDFAFSFIVFQHVPVHEAVVSTIRDVHRVLRPGSTFKFQVQGTQEPDYLRAPKDTWLGVTFSQEELDAIAAEIGFEVLDTAGAGTQYFWQWWRKPAASATSPVGVPAAAAAGSVPVAPEGRVAISAPRPAAGLSADVVDATVGELAFFARTFRDTLQGIKRRLDPTAAWSSDDPFETLGRLDRVLTGRNAEILRLCDGAPVAVVGAGDGDLGLLLASLGADVDLVDGGIARPGGVELARRLQAAVAIPATVHEVDLDGRPELPRSGYGLALCVDVLERVESPLLLLRSLAGAARHCVVDVSVAPPAADGGSPVGGLPVTVLAPAGLRVWLLTEPGLRALIDRAGWDVLDHGLVVTGPGSEPRAVTLLRSRIA